MFGNNVEHGCILIKRRNKKTETRKQKRGDPGDHEKTRLYFNKKKQENRNKKTETRGSFF
jgi:hypothetical protein